MRYQLWIVFLLLVGLTKPLQGVAQQVSLAELKELDLTFADARVVSTRPGSRIQLRVATLPGDEFALRLPFVPNQIEPLVAEGAHVAAGQPLVRVRGPELEAWLLQAEDTQQRYHDAQRRYEQNRPLFEQKALSAEAWLTISDRYQRLRLAMHHVEHVSQWLEAAGAEALLRAPKTGIVRFVPIVGVVAGSEVTVATIIDPQAVRITGSVPADSRETPVAFRVTDCDLAIDREARLVVGFRRQLWSEPASDCASMPPGLRLSGRIVFALDGYAIPRESILRYDGHTVVALRQGDALVLSEVRLHGEDDTHYYVTGQPELAQYPLLSRSTSALQGLLAGLGAD